MFVDETDGSQSKKVKYSGEMCYCKEGSFSCQNICSIILLCGAHNCQPICHPGPCVCSYSPETLLREAFQSKKQGNLGIGPNRGGGGIRKKNQKNTKFQLGKVSEGIKD